MYVLILKLAGLGMLWPGLTVNAEYGIHSGVLLLSLAFVVEYIEAKIKSWGKV